MKMLSKRALAPLIASLAFAAMPALAADSNAAIEVCKTSANGMVPHHRLTKAIDKMLDMGETPAAAKLSKEEKRKRQYDAFWKELTREGG